MEFIFSLNAFNDEDSLTMRAEYLMESGIWKEMSENTPGILFNKKNINFFRFLDEFLS